MGPAGRMGWAFAVLVVASVSTSGAAARKVVLRPIAAGAGLPEGTGAVLTEAFGAELRKVPGLQVVTPAEIAAVLSNEQQRQALGCEADACLVELGGALGAAELVAGSVARLGESWLVSLKLLDVSKGTATAQVSRRLRGGTIDDVLDALPVVSGELFGVGVKSDPLAVNVAPAAAVPRPANRVERPVTLAPELRARLVVLTDGNGAFAAYDPQQGTWDPVYFGDAAALWALRVIGGGSDGEGNFSRTFWEPRAKARWQASFERKGGAYALQCGDKAVPFVPAGEADAARVRKEARFHEAPWARRAGSIARDAAGSYFYVDVSRLEGGEPEPRLYVGRKGAMRHVPLQDAIVDQAGEVYLAEEGRLALPRGGPAEWVSPSAKTPLTPLVVEDQAAFIYGALGVYAGERLGTPCDGRW
jgi:hypothetical protein